MKVRLISFIQVLFIVGGTVSATEPDEAAIREAVLPDSTSIVEEQVILYLEAVVENANNILSSIVENGLRAPYRRKTKGANFFEYVQFDSIQEAAEYAFSRAYYDHSYDSLKDIGSPRIERLSHAALHQDDVFRIAYGSRTSILSFTSVYSGLTRGGVANLCGQNLGLDKLAHFFSDGFLMYNQLKEGKLKGYEEVRQLSDLFERSSMGLAFTGVYSQADIEANVAGVRFFENIFDSGLLVFNSSNQIEFKSGDFQLCDYFSADLSELTHPNQYKFLTDQHRGAYRNMTEGATTCDTCRVEIQDFGLGSLRLAGDALKTLFQFQVAERLRPHYSQRVYNAALLYSKKPVPKGRSGI